MNKPRPGLVLAIESTHTPGSVSLGKEERVLSTCFVEEGKQFSGEFLPLLEEMFSSAGKSQSDVSSVVVTQGPGSFTGVRVGLSFAKGISEATGIPVYPVPTLDIMAYEAMKRFPSATELYPCLDARKGEVYTCRYAVEDGRIVKKGDYVSIRPENLVYKIENPEACVFGPGFGIYREIFLTKGIGKERGGESTIRPDAGILLEYFFRVGGVTPVMPEALSAIYVRPSEAELKYKGGKR